MPTRWYAQPRFYGLVIAALVLGGGIGAAVALFWSILYVGISFIWETLPTALGLVGTTWWFVLIVCIGGGALVGICHRFLGDHPKEMHDALAEFRVTGRFDTAHILQGMITLLVSLAAGASRLEEEFVLLSGGETAVVQENLYNTYQRVNTP